MIVTTWSFVFLSMYKPGTGSKTYRQSIWNVLASGRLNKTCFFCSGIQFNLLLSPYPCFISLLYLDLYVLGDDALIS